MVRSAAMAERRTTSRPSSGSGSSHWRDEGTYEIDNDDPRPPFYVLCMYPYPSGPAHQGHVRNYTFGDLITRYRTMNGYGVLSPIGFDSFGLPAENAAIKDGVHPRTFTDARIAELSSSLQRIGASYDWRRMVYSHDPQLHPLDPVDLPAVPRGRPGLPGQRPGQLVPRLPDRARQRAGPRPTAPASGRGDVVQKRDLEQWFFKITAVRRRAARRPRRRSTGPSGSRRCSATGSAGPRAPSSTCRVVGADDTTIRVFTTRPDTSFGMTYVVLAPEHPLVAAITTRRAPGRGRGVRRAGPQHRRDRPAVLGGRAHQARHATGAHAVNPFTGEPVPIYIADYVLSTYGTGAIMAVPGQDQRDWDFAEAHGLPIIRTVQPPDGLRRARRTSARARPSTASGSTASASPRRRPRPSSGWRPQGIGERKVNFRLRDWLLSRQRFWGCPIPIVYCPDHGMVPVPDDELPVLAPDDVEFLPTGESPLKYHEGFLHTTCPTCGGPAVRETDTMDTFVDSSWYFLRFCDPWNEDAPVRPGRGRRSGCRSASTSAASSTPSST